MRGHAVKLTLDGGVPGVELIHTGPCDQSPNLDGECCLIDWVENVGDEITHGEVIVPIRVEWMNDDGPVLHLAPELPPEHPPALDPEDRERLERLVDYFRNTASGIVTANKGEPWDGCKVGETPASEAWWQAADTLEAALRDLASHQGGGEAEKDRLLERLKTSLPFPFSASGEFKNGYQAALGAVEALLVGPFPSHEEEDRAKRSGVCPVCQGHGGGDEPEGHEYSDCDGTCPECWCSGCHDGQDFPEDRLAELDDGEPCGSWLAYELVQAAHPEGQVER